MKLKNKRTGEVIDTGDYGIVLAIPSEDYLGYKAYDQMFEYHTIKSFLMYWEDYDENNHN